MATKKTVKKRVAGKRPPDAKSDAPIDSAADFERLIKEAADGQQYVLRLYVTGTTARSAQAIQNIHDLCEQYLKGHYELEVIDIYQQPNEAAAEQIIAAPTLVKELPEPASRLIGDLSDRGRVLVGLKLADRDISKAKWAKL